MTTMTETGLPGVWLIEPAVFGDERGFFYESWNQQRFNAAVGAEVQFVQDNHSCSSRGVLRGLHYQLAPHAQGKLVRCIRGEVYDVAVDIRAGSATFGQSFGTILSEQNKLQMWIPPGFAHGFVTLSDKAEFLYKTTDYWHRDCERAIHWDDPALAIAWPLRDGLSLSAKDLAAPRLAQLAAGDLPSR